MYALVRKWHKSKQSKADYCGSVPINIHTFTYWVQKYKEGEGEGKREAPKFIPLTESPAKAILAPALELNYPNDVRLCVNGQPDLELLRALIKVTV